MVNYHLENKVGAVNLPMGKATAAGVIADGEIEPIGNIALQGIELGQIKLVGNHTVLSFGELDATGFKGQVNCINTNLTIVVAGVGNEVIWTGSSDQSFDYFFTLKYECEIIDKQITSLANNLIKVNAPIDVVDLGNRTITISQAEILAEALQSNKIVTEFKISNFDVDALPVIEAINNIVERNKTIEGGLVERIKKDIVKNRKFDLEEVIKVLLSEIYDLRLIQKFLEISKHQEPEIQKLYTQASEDLYSWVVDYINQHLEKANFTNKKHYGFIQDLMDEISGISIVKMLQNLYTEQVYKQFYEQYQIIKNIIDAFNIDGNKQDAILLLRDLLPDIDQDLLKLYGVNSAALDQIVEYQEAQNTDFNNQDDELPGLIQNVSELGDNDNHLSDLD